MHFGSPPRAGWIDAAITFAVGLGGQLLLLVGFGSAGGAVGPVAGLAVFGDPIVGETPPPQGGIRPVD